MYNNDKNLQLYVSKDLSTVILQWLEQQMIEISSLSRKKINIPVVRNDIYSQPFLGKFLLKVNYLFFSNTQLMDFIDGTVLRKMSFEERKWKFLTLIEKYLHSRERKKFSDFYRQCLFKPTIGDEKQRSSSEVIRLILFIAIRSQNKDEFIERIFNMPIQNQQILMDQIMEVQSILQNITEKEELVLQFNSLKQINKQMKENYGDLVDYQNNLLDQCEKQHFAKSTLQKKVQQNTNEKIYLCQQLKINDPQKPYLKIYKNFNQKNAALTRILIQKQKKQNQLHEQHSSLKFELDEYEEVLFELKDEKKKIKVVLNDKKNQSFQLEMRASLRLSQEKENIEALKRKSQTKFSSALNDVSNNLTAWGQKSSRLRTKSIQEQYSQINQSVNILSKIKELKSQKQVLMRQLGGLRTENKKLRLKDTLSRDTFNQLSEIYSEFLSMYPGLIEQQPTLQKQRSKTTLKRMNSRYLDNSQCY